MNDPFFIRRFTQALRPGHVPADRRRGRPRSRIRSVIFQLDHDLSIRDVFRIYTKDRTSAGG